MSQTTNGPDNGLNSGAYRTSLGASVDWGLLALVAPTLAALTQPLGTQNGELLSWFGGSMAPLFLIGVVLTVIGGRTAPSRRQGACSSWWAWRWPGCCRCIC
jgi:NitT/TauT family transport system permease protein